MTRSIPTALVAAPLAAALVLGTATLALAQEGTAVEMPAYPSLATPDADDQVDMDIVTTLTDRGDFTTFLTALEAADLLGTLQEAGPFTLFAPTDEAFDALPEAAVASLMLPENRARLVAMIGYHIVPEKLSAQALSDMVSGIGADPATIPTVSGKTLVVDSRVGLTVDGAEVRTPDIGATNGIVHAIDTVLLPDAS